MAIGSTNCFGPSDLDTRPAEMERSTMPYWVQRCPSCGYCVENVEAKASEAARRLVESKGYKEILTDERFPELSNQFHCHALIGLRKRNHKAAFWSYLHAAWACDDELNTEGSKLFRGKAIEVLGSGGTKRLRVSEDSNVQDTMRVDLYRRIGQFESAERLAASIMENDLEDILKSILGYERWLIARGDDVVHNVQEAIDHGNGEQIQNLKDDDIVL